MASSTLITDYIQNGTHAARPASPNVPTTCSPLYYETDTTTLFVWTGAAWVAVGGASPANPTATAGPAAVNGSATTFMRSDGAPAIQKASSSQFGIVEVDGTSITASAGVISTVAAGSGLYHQVMSATPTRSGTGFTTTVDGGGGVATVTDGLTGISINALTNGAVWDWHALSKAAPATTNKTATALIGFTTPLNSVQAVAGMGYTDGTKLEMMVIDNHPGAVGPVLQEYNFSTKSAFASSSISGGAFCGYQLWMQFQDDGANIHMRTSYDGINFIDFYTASYAASYLGMAPTSIIFGCVSYNTPCAVTLMSYAET